MDLDLGATADPRVDPAAAGPGRGALPRAARGRPARGPGRARPTWWARAAARCSPGRRVRREEPRARRKRPAAGPGRVPRDRVRGRSGCWRSRPRSPPPASPTGGCTLLKSLAPLERSEALTRSLFYGGVSLSFVLVLLLLNLLLSRIVLAPVRRVHDAMARAATGDLRGAAARPLARRGGQHGRVVQPHGGRARGEPPRDRGLQPQPRGHGRGPHRRAARVRRRACSPSRTTWPRSSPTWARVSSRSTRAGASRPSTSARARSSASPRRGARPHPRGGARRRRDGAARRGGGRGARRARGLGTRPRSCASCPRAGARSPSWPRPSSARAAGPSAPWWWSRTSPRSSPRQRLEAWKEAVERVIHEIKNPLTPVGLAAETLKTAWERDPAPLRRASSRRRST